MNWLRKWEIARLKRRMRRADARMQAVMANVDCGRQLARMISSEYRRADREWFRCMVRLKEIDPTFPPSWREIAEEGLDL